MGAECPKNTSTTRVLYRSLGAPLVRSSRKAEIPWLGDSILPGDTSWTVQRTARPLLA